MPRKSPPLTVRCWAPDDSGGYRPLESLSMDELEAFRKRNAERANAALQNHFRAHPEAFVQTVKAVEAYESGLSMQTGARRDERISRSHGLEIAAPESA